MNINNFLKHLKQPPIPISPKDDFLIKELKEKFEHNKRSFIFNRFKYYVDCLYCHAMLGTIEKTLTILDSTIKKDPSKIKLLNLGGGTGQVSDMIKYLGYDVYNLDIEVENEDSHNKQHNLNDNIELPYEEIFFDVVLCQEVIEHIENPWKLFRDVSRVLKTDGILILTTPNIQSRYSKKIFCKNQHGFFHWFKEKDLDYHINPLPYWEIDLISKKNNYKLIEFTGNGNYFFKNNSLESKLAKNENLIFVFQKTD